MEHDTEAAQREIHGLMLRYCELLDTGDIHGWIDCFTDDGVFEGLRGPVEGGDRLRAYGTASLQRGFFLHLLTNVQVRVDAGDPGRATARSHLLYVERSPDGAGRIVAGVQHDVLRRVSGTWKIARRRLDAQPIVSLPGAAP